MKPLNRETDLGLARLGALVGLIALFWHSCRSYQRHSECQESIRDARSFLAVNEAKSIAQAQLFRRRAAEVCEPDDLAGFDREIQQAEQRFIRFYSGVP
jgi:hypothetical protein